MSSRVIIPVLLSVMYYPMGSGAPGIFHELVLEGIWDGQDALQMLARPGNGRAHLLNAVARNVGDFLQGETFDSVEDERLPFAPAGIAQSVGDQRDQLAPCRQLFGIVGRGIGDDVLLRESLVGLVELEHRLIAG